MHLATTNLAVVNKLIAHTHANHHVIDHHGFYTHTAHHLGSLHFLDATDNKIEELYKGMHDEVNFYQDSPHEITRTNWRQSIGDKRFCKAYQEFFDQELAAAGNDWRQKFMEFLLDNESGPLINCVVAGVAHPLIHIGYAFELDSIVVASEALTMCAASYNYLHEVIDKLKPPKSGSKSALTIFQDLRSDHRLPLFDGPGVDNLEPTVKQATDIILSHYDQWLVNVNDLEKIVEELFDLTVYLYGATHKPDQIEFDFFLLHLLTSMNAIRMIYPHLNNRQVAEHILYQFFYFASAIYIGQLRPEINKTLIHDYNIDYAKQNWNYVIEQSMNTDLIGHSHFLKVIRSLRDAEAVYGFKDGLYLKTAVKTIENINKENMWIGGPTNPRQLNVLKRA
ncbi:unnamed protein product [Adineta steineri]|uniref:Uncharacterized protein n=2 Tax=Adineta steineri TaxID=433720 RepID=A0A818ZNA8_9BILA|nr:unnamed protein product [Adineta steineri]CAF3771983.1 unnamed protein product [Adineta steineri]